MTEPRRPSLWTRIGNALGYGPEQRSIDVVAEAIASRYRGFGTTVVTPESAARKVAVGSAQRLLSNAARIMPANAYRGEDAATVQLSRPAVLADPEGAGRGFGDWVAQVVWSLASRGNAYGHIVDRDIRTGLPSRIVPIHPDLISPYRETSDSPLRWQISGGKLLDADQVMHLRLFPVPGQVLGLSPIEQHAATIGIGIAAEKFGSDFYESGGHPTGILSSASALPSGIAAQAKARFMASTAAREPVFLPNGIDYKQVQIAPNESQFIEALGLSNAECARIFGPGVAEILGYDSGGSMTYSNVADKNLHLLTYALDAYLSAVEVYLTACLPRGQYARLNRNALLRTNIGDRYKAYQAAASIGLQTPNEQRALEELPPVPWGDAPYVPGQYVPDDPAAAPPEDPALAEARAGGDDQLKHYWTKTPEGLSKWADHPHPWTALEHHLRKHMSDEMAKRVASQWFHDVKGYWPGDQAGKNPVGPG